MLNSLSNSKWVAQNVWFTMQFKMSLTKHAIQKESQKMHGTSCDSHKIYDSPCDSRT